MQATNSVGSGPASAPSGRGHAATADQRPGGPTGVTASRRPARPSSAGPRRPATAAARSPATPSPPTSARPPRPPTSRSTTASATSRHRHRPDQRDHLHVHGGGDQQRGTGPASAPSPAVTPEDTDLRLLRRRRRSSTPATPPRSSWASSSPPTPPARSPASASTRPPTNTGTHIGNLWSSAGTLLASATFTNETRLGLAARCTSPARWRSPPGTTYVAGYLAPNGHYSVDPAGLTCRRSTTRRCTRSSNGDRRQRRLRLRRPPAPSPPQLQRHQLLGRRPVLAVLLERSARPGLRRDAPRRGTSGATVTWTAPRNGGSAITSYTITPYIGVDRPDGDHRDPALRPPTIGDRHRPDQRHGVHLHGQRDQPNGTGRRRRRRTR